MKGTSLVALGSLAGLVASIVIYSRYPLPGTWTSATWTSSGFYLSVALLALGLLCFLAFLISGLITLLNWYGERARDANGDR